MSDAGSGARLYVFAAMLLAALRFWQIPFSAVADADRYLAHVASVMPFEHAAAFDVFRVLTAQYRVDAPGWFPLGPLPLALWLTGPSAAFVKSVQYAMLVGAFGLFAFVARKLLGSSAAAIVAVVAALCAWQFRTIHDPAIGTSLLGTWAAATVLAAFAFWFGYRESGKPIRLSLCYLSLALATLNGPVACGLGAVLAVVALRSQRPAAAYGVVAIVTLGIAGIVATAPLAAPWQHGGGYVRNVALQWFAALPASFRAVGNLPVAHVADLYYGTRYVDDRYVLIPPITLAGWAFAILSATTAYFVALAAPAVRPARREGDALTFGIGFWLIPALALGAPGEWQAGLPLGQAFESVPFEYFGLAVLAALAFERLRGGASPAARLVPSLLALAAFVLSYGNARSDAYAMSSTARLDEPMAAVARAAKAGFLERLPADAVLVPAEDLHLENWTASSLADPKYALFALTGKRYVTAPYDSASPSPRTWILAATAERGVPVTLSRWTSGRAGAPLVDRAAGFTTDRGLALHAAGVRRGVERSVATLPGGFAIDARRLCGPVALAVALAPSRPSIVWNKGFVPPGPIGYYTGPMAPMQTVLGTYLTFFPKLYMTAHAVATIEPTACAPGTISFKFVAAAWKTSHLVVRTPNDVERFVVDDRAPTLLVRVKLKTAAPFRLYFSTDAPAADWESNFFRYDRDRPFKRRLVIEPSDVWETP